MRSRQLITLILLLTLVGSAIASHPYHVQDGRNDVHVVGVAAGASDLLGIGIAPAGAGAFTAVFELADTWHVGDLASPLTARYAGYALVFEGPDPFEKVEVQIAAGDWGYHAWAAYHFTIDGEEGFITTHGNPVRVDAEAQTLEVDFGLIVNGESLADGTWTKIHATSWDAACVSSASCTGGSIGVSDRVPDSGFAPAFDPRE